MLQTEKLGLLLGIYSIVVLIWCSIRLRLKTLGLIRSLIVYHGISDIPLKDADRALTYKRVYPQGPIYTERDVAAVESPQCVSPSRFFNTAPDE
jgi:hypothetical protein